MNSPTGLINLVFFNTSMHVKNSKILFSIQTLTRHSTQSSSSNDKSEHYECPSYIFPVGRKRKIIEYTNKQKSYFLSLELVGNYGNQFPILTGSKTFEPINIHYTNKKEKQKQI